MLFNSISFAIFLPVVFFLYWFVAGKQTWSQNILLLAASYFFYACWDYRFLSLVAFSTILDYFSGIMMGNARNQRSKKFWFVLSIVINLGFLALFKYYNFFIESFMQAFSYAGLKVHISSLQLILPLGISFYTFHGLSYVIDIYNNKIQPEKDIIRYSLFVSFFPLLVAGPIERATHLLPQLKEKRTFNYSQAVDGMRQILWGLFKKIVIADNCAEFANLIFDNYMDYPGSTRIAGALFFTFQIYGDFSGYSDIAIGSAKLFGIDLLRNFAFPYFSRNIAEFWRRWHISLSSWFRDYLYIPLGGNKGSNWKKVRNILIVFLVSGFWHGANWTFIAWGLLHAIYIIPSVVFKTNRAHLDIVAQGRSFPGPRDTISIMITFSLTVLAWIFFRSADMTHAINYFSGIFSSSLFSIPYFPNGTWSIPTIIFIILFMIIEWSGREEQYALARLGMKWPRAARWAFYYGIILLIYFFAGTKQQFIYFQF